jgi:glycerol-3-phosphate dehydrogenase (NAD(P)+)
MPERVMNKINKIAILGAGMWGRTLAVLLAKNDLEIHLWDIRSDLENELSEFYKKMQSNGHPMSSTPIFDKEIRSTCEKADLLFCVLPAESVRDVFWSIRRMLSYSCLVVIASKGIEEIEIGFSLMSDIVQDSFGESIQIGVLSGPNLSLEIQARHPAVSLIASEDEDLIKTVMELLSSKIFRVYGSHDVVGVQIGGAVKNIIALAAGMVDELGFEYNTKAALLTRGLAEIARLGTKLGGNKDTFAGISGLGDLICTASSPTSRNYRAGRLFGQGKKREAIIAEIGQVIEGISTSKSVYNLVMSLGIEMPICKGVYYVVWESKNPLQEISELMTRDLKYE